MPAKNISSKYPVKNITSTVPYPTELLSQAPWSTFLGNNGYVGLSRKLVLKVFSSFDDVHAIWNKFSPNSSVFDLWNIRKSFWDGYHFNPYFLTIIKQQKSDMEIIGLLPLWFNADSRNATDLPGCDSQKYTWWGSNWPEDNLFFVKDPEYIPLILTTTPSPIELACIKPLPEYQFLLDFPGFSKEEDAKYYLDLTHIKSVDDYLAKLKKKKRYNLKRDRKRILSLNPKIIINESSHLENLFDLSIRRFRELFPDEPDEQSAFEDERRKNVFRSLRDNATDYKARIITTVINGRIEAVEFGLVHNKTYYALNSGADISNYSGIGVFSNLLVLEDALNLGCTKIDFLEGDNNWKDSWHLSHFYQYQFKK